MWDLFDFNSDGKTSLFEKVVGIELLESTFREEALSINDNESDENGYSNESGKNEIEYDEDDFIDYEDDDGKLTSSF